MDLTVTTFLSLDGVMQGPGGPTEDPSNGFDRGGWLAPLFDAETGAYIDEIFGRADALLLGRRTYELMAAAWPNVEEPGIPINDLPKHVATTTLSAPLQWKNSTPIEGDVFDAVRRLKSQPGRELQIHGSGRLAQALMREDLIDRLHAIVFPVVVGTGMRLFEGDLPATAVELSDSRTTPGGVALNTYAFKGRATVGEVPEAAVVEG